MMPSFYYLKWIAIVVVLMMTASGNDLGLVITRTLSGDQIINNKACMNCSDMLGEAFDGCQSCCKQCRCKGSATFLLTLVDTTGKTNGLCRRMPAISLDDQDPKPCPLTLGKAWDSAGSYLPVVKTDVKRINTIMEVGSKQPLRKRVSVVDVKCYKRGVTNWHFCPQLRFSDFIIANANGNNDSNYEASLEWSPRMPPDRKAAVRGMLVVLSILSATNPRCLMFRIDGEQKLFFPTLPPSKPPTATTETRSRTTESVSAITRHTVPTSQRSPISTSPLPATSPVVIVTPRHANSTMAAGSKGGGGAPTLFIIVGVGAALAVLCFIAACLLWKRHKFKMGSSDGSFSSKNGARPGQQNGIEMGGANGRGNLGYRTSTDDYHRANGHKKHGSQQFPPNKSHYAAPDIAWKPQLDGQHNNSSLPNHYQSLDEPPPPPVSQRPSLSTTVPRRSHASDSGVSCHSPGISPGVSPRAVFDAPLPPLPEQAYAAVDDNCPRSGIAQVPHFLPLNKKGSVSPKGTRTDEDRFSELMQDRSPPCEKSGFSRKTSGPYQSLCHQANHSTNPQPTTDTYMPSVATPTPCRETPGIQADYTLPRPGNVAGPPHYHTVEEANADPRTSSDSDDDDDYLCCECTSGRRSLSSAGQCKHKENSDSTYMPPSPIQKTSLLSDTQSDVGRTRQNEGGYSSSKGSDCPVYKEIEPEATGLIDITSPVYHQLNEP